MAGWDISAAPRIEEEKGRNKRKRKESKGPKKRVENQRLNKERWKGRGLLREKEDGGRKCPIGLTIYLDI